MFTLALCFLAAAADLCGLTLRTDGLADLKGEERLYEGRVLSAETAESGALTLCLRVSRADGVSVKGMRNVLADVYGESGAPEDLVGAQVSLRAVIEEPYGRRNPRCFDYKKYLLGRGIVGRGTAEKLTVTDGGEERLLISAARALLRKKREFIEALPEDSRAVVSGLLFGDVSCVPEDIYEDFRANGTAHVLAVSGLHVSLVYDVFRRLRGKKQSISGVLLTAAVLFVYVFLASFSVSAVRAGLMILLKCIAQYRDRRYDALTAAAAAALAMLLANPYVVLNTAFQMSFLAVLSIEFIGKRLPKRIPRAVAAMTAVYLGLAPYQAFVFNCFSLTAPLANLPVIYLAELTVPTALFAFIGFAALGTVFPAAHLLAALSQALTGVNGLLAAGGAGSVDVCSPPAGVILGVYACGFFLLSEGAEIAALRGQKKKPAAVLCLLLAAAVSAQAALAEPCAVDTLVFVDVGQGDCVHLRAAGNDVLIDGGGRTDYNVGKKILKPYLLKNGAGRVELALATHSHTDHFKGLEELREEGLADDIRTGCLAGKTFRPAEDVLIETLWPVSLEEDPGQEENGSCSVFKIRCGGVKILITGDLDAEGERKMLALYKGTDALAADILKIGHHGSAGSTSDEFLEAVSPKYAVFQVGKNGYGHPSPKVIEKCRQKGIMVLRNDLNGAVGFSFEEGRIRCHAMIE